jgi:hydrogenase 3 maturation protease
LLNGGSAPENYLHRIRELAPEQVLIVDAADMDLAPGEIQMIDESKLAETGIPFLMTTHTLPLTFLMEAIREFVPRVALLGIQPEVVAFGYPVSASTKQAVERVYHWLEKGESL